MAAGHGLLGPAVAAPDGSETLDDESRRTVVEETERDFVGWERQSCDAFVDELLNEFARLTSRLGEAAEGGVDLGVEFVAESRQESVANEVACVVGLVVCWVVAPRLMERREVFSHFFARDREHGADDVDAVGERSLFGDSSEAGEAGASNNAMQHGFGLIVGGVGHGDGVCCVAKDDFRDGVVSGAAGGAFGGDGIGCRDVDSDDVAGEIEIGRQALDEVGVSR